MAVDICLADVDQSGFDISNPAEFDGYPTTITRDYTCYDDDPSPSRTAVEIALLASPLCPALDPNYGLLHRKNIAVSAVSAGGNPHEFVATCTWEKWQPESTGEEFLGGSITLQTETVYRCISQTVYYAAGLPVPEQKDPGDLVNVNFGAGEGDKGSVSGVELPFPVMSFDIRKMYTKGTVTLSTIATIRGYVGRPNSTTWRTDFPAGTVRIAGVTPNNSDPDQDEITWSFESIPNETDIVIKSPFGTGDITVATKQGFEYLWLLTRSYSDASGWVMEAPYGAAVAQLVPPVDINAVIP